MENPHKPIHHFDFELLPCPFCKGGATALPSRISCDICLCSLEKGSRQTFPELVACWNSREGIEPSGRMSDILERHHYERWMLSRNSSNPPVETCPMDAWFARAQLETCPRKLRGDVSEESEQLPAVIGDRKIDRAALVESLRRLVESNTSAESSAESEFAQGVANDALELLEQYDGVLRNLCMFVSAGGWNSEGLIDPMRADEKIRWGIDYMVKVDWPRPLTSIKK